MYFNATLSSPKDNNTNISTSILQFFQMQFLRIKNTKSAFWCTSEKSKRLNNENPNTASFLPHPSFHIPSNSIQRPLNPNKQARSFTSIVNDLISVSKNSAHMFVSQYGTHLTAKMYTRKSFISQRSMPFCMFMHYGLKYR